MTSSRSASLVLAGIVLAIAACAADTAIVSGTKRTPVPPERVMLYFDEPARFEVISVVSASSGTRWNDERAVEYALKELKKKAASLGANGLLLELDVHTKTRMDQYKPMTEKTLQGTAIFVEEPHEPGGG